MLQPADGREFESSLLQRATARATSASALRADGEDTRTRTRGVAAMTIIGHETKLRAREEGQAQENLTALVGPALERWMHAVVSELGLAGSGDTARGRRLATAISLRAPLNLSTTHRRQRRAPKIAPGRSTLLQRSAMSGRNATTAVLWSLALAREETRTTSDELLTAVASALAAQQPSDSDTGMPEHAYVILLSGVAITCADVADAIDAIAQRRPPCTWLTTPASVHTAGCRKSDSSRLLVGRVYLVEMGRVNLQEEALHAFALDAAGASAVNRTDLRGRAAVRGNNLRFVADKLMLALGIEATLYLDCECTSRHFNLHLLLQPPPLCSDRFSAASCSHSGWCVCESHLSRRRRLRASSPGRDLCSRAPIANDASNGRAALSRGLARPMEPVACGGPCRARDPSISLAFPTDGATSVQRRRKLIGLQTYATAHSQRCDPITVGVADQQHGLLRGAIV